MAPVLLEESSIFSTQLPNCPPETSDIQNHIQEPSLPIPSFPNSGRKPRETISSHRIPVLLSTNRSSLPDQRLFQVHHETFFELETPKTEFPTKVVEQEPAVYIPPLKEYSVKVRIQKIEKGKPLPFDPEDF
jgi:hypothetical protein